MEIKAENLKKRTRLDSYIGIVYPTLSRSTAKKLILNKVVKVNGEFTKFNKILVEGDIITFEKEALEQFITQTGVTEVIPVKMNLDIIFEDENIIVLNKDEGVVVHPSYNHLEDTLMNGLVYYIQDSDQPFQRIRPVNRLDKETSGVILFSKNLESHNFFSRQFKKRTVTKEYIAVVKGDFRKELDSKTHIKVSNFMAKSPEGFTYRISKDSTKSEYAETDIYFNKIIEKEGTTFSELKVVPHTGRTHQIRVHLKSIGYSIVGDTLYRGMEYSRVLLHSHTLKIKSFDNKEMVFTAEPKNWFRQN
jgi:23S rRNA pseudouridine1911/1915/1917 synthase